MDVISHLAVGFGVALTPINLLYALVGALLGILIGVLPGIGPVATIAMRLPTTYALEPVSALIMLAGIYYGEQYGGSTTSILINMPGEVASAVTCLDGYQMARRGEAGAALTGAAVGSFIAGCVSTVLVAAFSPPLSSLALKFGSAEIISNLELGEKREVLSRKIKGFGLSRRQIRDAAPAVARGTAIGSVLRILPGGGAMLASFAAYSPEKKLARDPSQFGKGAIQGVAAPESANNAGAQVGFIPLLTLGIPENAVMAIMVGAMTIHNIQLGPQVMASNPDLFWGLIASMWVGHLMLIVLNLPLIGIGIRLLTVPYRMLYPAILLFCGIGVYSISNTSFDVSQTAFFGLIGVLFVKLACEPAPLLLGFVLRPMMEENLRRTLLLSRGDATVFLTRPLSAVLLAAAVLLVVFIALPKARRRMGSEPS